MPIRIRRNDGNAYLSGALAAQGVGLKPPPLPRVSSVALQTTFGVLRGSA